MEMDRERLRKQEQALRKDMGKQRVRQLKVANEEEDKTIRKLEKLLKIDKTKGKKKIPKMFNDGLDYALEMCLPENIEKMYEAAKEAASTLDQSDTEWQEDFDLVAGKSKEQQTKGKEKKVSSGKDTKGKSVVSDQHKNATDTKKMARLRQVEKKYFTDSDLESDLSDVDSEFEESNLDKINGSKAKENGRKIGDEESEEEQEDFNDTDDDEEFGDEDEDDDEDDEPPEEVMTTSKCSTKRKLEREENTKKSLKNEPKVKSKKHSEYIDDEEGDYRESGDESNDGLEDIMEGLSDDEVESHQTKPNKKPKPSDLDDEEYGSDSNESDEGSLNSPEKEEPNEWEDIYGRKRDKQGNIVTETSNKYVPPHLRARLKQSNETGEKKTQMDAQQLEKLQRLKKLLKGYLNRLSETNMHKISTDIDDLYMKNSRNDMNNTLSTLIYDALVTNVLAPERMVMEHAMLIAVLHANIGSEVGAHFLQTLIDRFMLMLDDGIERYAIEDKTLDNILFILCHMYTFKVSRF